MNEKKFDPKKLQKLNNPNRLLDIPPDYIKEKLNSAESDIIVEIGAGTAFFAIAFLPIFKPSTIYACDMSQVMIDWVTENVVPKHPAILPVKTTESTVPLKDAMADIVYMINLHHELETPLLSIKEANRLLKPGGKIFIVDWKKKEMDDGPPERIRCLPETVKDQLLEGGFEDIFISDHLPKHFFVMAQKA